MRRVCAYSIVMFLACVLAGCDFMASSDTKQRKQQEALLQEATAQTGMPAIKNFRERKLLKDILELRDQDGLITYTYLWSEQTGRMTYLGETVGYGLPYATQYTNPMKLVSDMNVQSSTLPQADPNGLFSPSSADGTWVLMRDPVSGRVVPQYLEPRIIVLTFKLAENDPRLTFGSPVIPAEKGP